MDLKFSPNGYTCDTKAGRCNKGEISIPFFEKTQSKSIEEPSEPEISDIICPVIQ